MATSKIKAITQTSFDDDVNKIYARRYGNVVAVTFINASSSAGRWLNELPSDFRPDIYTNGFIRINTAMGMIGVDSNGTIECMNISSGSLITNASNVKGVITYIV